MNQQDREYELEMARDVDADERTPEQQRLLRVSDMSASFESERAATVNDRRAAGIDDRLIESYQLYVGQQDARGRDTFDSLPSQPTVGSRAYVNIARQITNDGVAQIGDLLFPNDDRNYGLNPVSIARPPMALEAEPAVDSGGQPLVDAEGNPLNNIQAHQRRVERTRKKAKRMFTKVDASLIRARYPSKARKVIFNGASFGTGVIKGPIPTKDKKGRWAKKTDGGYGLKKGKALLPDVRCVSPLDWYPDMSCSELDECRFVWERMALQPSELERGVKDLGFNKEAVTRILATAPNSATRDSSDPTDEARAALSANGRAEGRYIVWERHGNVTRQQLEDLDVKYEGNQQYINVVLTLCDGETLKAVVVPYESDECIYSVYSWDEDPMSVFGFGIPWLMKDQQASYVAAWRMALDNGGMSAVPQILIDREGVEPVDGRWEIRGGKEWYLKKQPITAEGHRQPFQVVEITENLEFILVLMDRSNNDAYEITGVTRVDKAQQGLDNAPVTLGATQIVQNNTSVSRRSQARRWDDQVTLGLVTRVYDYFMQFEEDDDIKAHMEVEPRGATVLLAKELTATNTIQLYQMTQNGVAPGAKGIPLLRGIESAMQIPAGSYVETEEEQEAREAQEQEQGEQPDPMLLLEERKVEVLEAEVELSMMDRQLNTLKATQAYETNMMKLQLDEAKALANLDDKAQERVERYHGDMDKLREKHSADLQRHMEENKSKRDIAAAKIGSDGGVKAREATVRERDISLKERELNNKITTGQEGI